MAPPEPDGHDLIVSRLTRDLGSQVSTNPADLLAARQDSSGILAEGVPIALVRATSREDVQSVLLAANDMGFTVVPRGAGTGLAGGASGSTGDVVLSLELMNSILELSPEDGLAVVQPGVINADLNAAAEAHGLWFAPDPASRDISTVGGNIATNAGGLLCAKYGVTREAVLGLTVVLADGRLISTGHRTVKGVTGYDITALMTGSEGTLGVIVEATVRLTPLPEPGGLTVGAYFASTDQAASASAAITAAHIRPAVMELMDAPTVRAIDDLFGRAPRERPEAYLLINVDGAGAEAAAEAIYGIIERCGGSATTTQDPDESEQLFEFRRSMFPAMDRLGHMLVEDVAVPRSRLAEMFRVCEEIGARYEADHGIRLFTIAHAGDGNLHPTFVFDRTEAPGEPPVVPESVWAAAEEIFRAGLRLGGTLTGEHGIGVLKRRWLAEELGPVSYDLQRRVKEAFDPRGILNPGKIFPPG